jgi:hypothetical protein
MDEGDEKNGDIAMARVRAAAAAGGAAGAAGAAGKKVKRE